MPEVTVLTAVRNGKKFLPETIASIQAQTFADWEYIIVDDGSTDSTTELIEREAERDKRIRLVRREKPGGPFVAATDGVRFATGKYIVRIDGDDIATPTRISTQVSFLKDHQDLKACASFAGLLVDSEVIPNYIYNVPLTSGSLKWYICLQNRLVHSTACVEHNVFLTHYCDRTRYAVYEPYSLDSHSSPVPDVEDFRMWSRLSCNGVLGVIPQVLVYLRRHESRISNIRRNEQQTLALNVLGEHLRCLIGEDLEIQELHDLYSAGYTMNMPLQRGLRLLEKWRSWWLRDDSLSREEKSELARITRSQFLRFLRRNYAQDPVLVLRLLPSVIAKICTSV